MPARFSRTCSEQWGCGRATAPNILAARSILSTAPASYSGCTFSATPLQFRSAPSAFSLTPIGVSRESKSDSNFGRPPASRIACLFSGVTVKIQRVDTHFSSSVFDAESMLSTISSMPPASLKATLFWSLMTRFRIAPEAFSRISGFALVMCETRRGSAPSLRIAARFSTVEEQFHMMPVAFSTTASFGDSRSPTSVWTAPYSRMARLPGSSMARFHSAPAAFSCAISSLNSSPSSGTAPSRSRSARFVLSAPQFQIAPAILVRMEAEGCKRHATSFSMPLTCGIAAFTRGSRVKRPRAIATLSRIAWESVKRRLRIA
mmetsp:Transcript_35631/g.109843  ORF Transcript_35631/g.109843 Transcript_35631/m.109843 type:complete len:318 (-) Transcript_35631:163-1116(-)